MHTLFVKFYGILFDRAQGKISLNDESFHLEHQQTKILNLLIDHQNSVVSRDQIAEEVWQGVIVEDNTISKAITRLRKVLNDSAKSSRIIKTIPKKGYQFIAPIEDCSDQHVEKLHSQTKKQVWIKQAVFLVLLITSIFSLVSLQNKSSQPTLQSSVQSLPKPISYKEGIELNAHLHPDLKHLLFLGDTTDGYAIFTKNLSDGKNSIITQVSSRSIYPKWLHGEEYSFVYSDLDKDQQCRIFQVTIAKPLKKDVIATCLSTSSIEVFVHGEENIIVWSDNSGNWQQNLFTGNRQPIPFKNREAKYQMPSPNGALWASLTYVDEHSVLSVYDRQSKSLLLEKKLPYTISHFKWSKGSDALYHLGEHPANQLFQLSLNGEQHLLASTSQGSMTHISDVQSNQTIEFIISMVDLDIYQLDGGKETKLINSSFPDYNPAISRQSNFLAFASKRTGSAQIWIKNENGSLEQVSQFESASYIYEIVWSPDEKNLLVKRNDSIHIINLATHHEKILPIDAHTKINWQWVTNQRIAYIDQTSHSLFSIDMVTLSAELIQSKVELAQYTDNQWFISDPLGDSLFKFNSTFTDNSLITDQLNNRRWLIDHENVYILNTDNNKPTTLVSLDDEGTEEVILKGNFSPLSIRSINHGKLVFHRASHREANIYQLQLE